MVLIGLPPANPIQQLVQVRADLLSQPAVSTGFYRIVRKGHGKAFYTDEFTSMLTTMLPQMAGNEGQPA